MTNREKLNSMTDEEFVEWLCVQLWSDYGERGIDDAVRYNMVRNFLKSECKEEGANNAERPAEYCEIGGNE